ncbi:ATPase H(+)-transporting accessory protein 2 [Chrysoperla carnea]|uniref:ATPase H(+)-transporting accessory protein 2 n=1 Tax=Chrysoperla carnea TaxID=189513 RepID=UPI001D0918ED|nr:ATPase H(+)-transporting accessory protein 2 [Chrysoperla carnea]
MSLRVILYTCSLISFVYGAGELLILNSPDSLRWKGNPSLDESMLKEVYSAAMGYTIEKNSNWNGMYIQDPFNYPEALVHVAIEGVTNLGKYSPLDVPKYPLNTDEDEFSTWRAMKHRVIERHPEDNNTLVRVELSGGLQELNKYRDILNDLSVELNYPSSEELQVDIEENRKFFEEIAVMNAISEKIKMMKDNLQDANQDIYWFVFTSLHAVSDFHGPDSRATAQAREILIDSLQKLTHNMNQAYNGRVLVTAVTSDASHTRRARALLAEDNVNASGASATTESSKSTVPTVNLNNPQDVTKWNLAADYNENYPVIFNIILWFGVAFFFSLLAVSYVIATMDPGRDSIIYRMTSNRMKKDN